MAELSKSIRLSTTPGGTDKHLNLKLEQNFDFLEVLSLKISQEDVYTNPCSNYGVVVGRVLANKGFGVPNAKVSIFIPITSEDENNELIKDLYPYKTVTDKDSNNIRYNLLLSRTTCELNKPVGTFPDKETLLNNDIVIEVFDKYYKYTTKTNSSGDYMLFGVPVGQRILHMDVDLSDAGLLSIRPYDLISQGAPEGFFESYSKFKVSTNLDSLPQIKSSNQSVDVIPFWGDPESCEIGITRLDIDTNVELETTALFMGSIFSDKEKNSINKRCNPRNKMGELDELRTGAGTINFIRAKKIDPVQWVNTQDVVPVELEYFDINGGDVIDDDGTFVVTLPMNVGRVVTDEFGNLVPSQDPEIGLPTKGAYRMKLSFTEAPANIKRRTANLIIPSLSREHGGTGGYSSTGNVNDINGTEDQRFTDNVYSYKDINKDFHTFEWKQLYTISQFIKKYKKGASRWSWLGLKNTDKEGASNNPLPFNTAVRKADFIFALGSFFLQIGAAFIKFFVILLTLEFGFYLGFNLSFTIFGNTICLARFYRVIRVVPFGWIGGILGRFCDEPDEDYCAGLAGPCPNDARGFTLSCGDDAIFCLRTDSGGDLCGAGSGPPCAGSFSCNSGQNCNGGSFGTCTSFVCFEDVCGCPGNASDPGSACYDDTVCIKAYGFVASQDNCTALQLIQQWLCCRILELAEERNVIRRSLFDAWLVGSAYMFQYKYKAKIRKKQGQLVKKEKFCGPGSDTKGGNNYHKNKCCPHDEDPNNECRKCLVKGPGTSDKNYSNIEDYHKDWHNATVNGQCGNYSCGNGATDIQDNIYCNAYNSTKIVSLGRVEMCPDTLNDIEKAINANNSVFDLYKQNPGFFTGTFYEEGWDPNFWSQNMGPTSYQSPEDVIRWLLNLKNCKIGKLFKGGSGCHEKELEDFAYQWVKEVSKIYTDIVTVQTDINTDLEQFSPGTVDAGGDEDEDGPIISGYLFDNLIAQRFSPCGGSTGVNCNQPPLLWSGQDVQIMETGPGVSHNGSKNIPYYYFGLTPGKTAIEKLRKQFFVN
jgi:hypothetical protein